VRGVVRPQDKQTVQVKSETRCTAGKRGPLQRDYPQRATGKTGDPGQCPQTTGILGWRGALAALDSDAVRKWCPSCRDRVPIASRTAADLRPRKQTRSPSKTAEQQQPHPRHGDTARRWRRALQHGPRDAAFPPVRAPARARGPDRRPQSSAVGAAASALSPLRALVLTLRLVYPSSRRPIRAAPMRSLHMQCYARRTEPSSCARCRHQIRSSSPSPRSKPMATRYRSRSHVLLHRALRLSNCTRPMRLL
jgi:hypothetical protein